MRRKHLSERDRRRHRRLIPAHAGKTPRSRGAAARTWAHPRSRGENQERTAPMPGPLGSSPLTQGKRCMILPTGRPVRLIPTHAGKTAGSFPEWSPFGAHPRSRGENASAVSAAYPASGSSPLTRGKPFILKHLESVSGLIPAHAGKTTGELQSVLTLWAHPRSRGENGFIVNSKSDHWGSSPLTRGKRAKITSSPTYKGLIPAHAGKTGRCHRRGSRRTAHPRSRGENGGCVVRSC